MNRFLLFISDSQKSASDQIQVHFAIDYPVAFAQHADELRYLAWSLSDQGLLRSRGIDYPSGADEFYSVTPSGWKAVDELKRTRLDSDQAFVAMWFTDEMKQVYEEGIRPALVNTGLRPFLVSEPYHDGRIDDLIIGEIRRSGFLIADFTGHRPNVYFEAGLAMGIGVYVIRTCHNRDIKKLHFDQRQYRCTLWETPDDLRKQLQEHIRAIRVSITD